MHDVLYLTDQFFERHKYPQSHPENESRLINLNKQLKKSHLYTHLIQPSFEKINLDTILLAHKPSLIKKLENNTDIFIDSDTYLSKSSFECAKLASGALKKAIDETINNNIKRSFSAVRPPGHHAEYDKSMGFCLINHIAIAARYAQSKGFSKIMIIDFDVHHGNGTEDIFKYDNTVLYLSSHQSPLFPGTGLNYDKDLKDKTIVNWPLPPRTSGKTLISLYDKELPQLIKNFKPELILVSAGYDIHHLDPLGGFNITTNEIKTLVSVIIKHTLNIPIHFSLEGGYHLNALSESIIKTLEVLIEKN